MFQHCYILFSYVVFLIILLLHILQQIIYYFPFVDGGPNLGRNGEES